MNAIAFLKAAYIITWVIYLGYLAQILLRMKKVQEERAELERTTARDTGSATMKRSAG